MKQAELLMLDKQDPLAKYRSQFRLPRGAIYFCCHSLGALPKHTEKQLSDFMCQEWGNEAVQAWNHCDWINMPMRLGKKLAPLLGANTNEVIVADSLSINLFKLLMCGLNLNPGRHIILTEEDNFPADLYIAEAVSKLNPNIKIIKCKRDEIANQINKNVAIVMLTHINYRTSEIYDMRTMAELAHRQGALILFDLAHSAGILPLSLSDSKIDLAVGCGYKYLHGGPGAPGFLYVAKHHHKKMSTPLTGWMGHQSPFLFADTYVAANDVRRFLCGTPHIIAMKAFESAIDFLSNISLDKMYAKTKKLGALMIKLMSLKCPEMKLESPMDTNKRGGHIGFSHPEAYAINCALSSAGFISDYREPNLIRFGLSPLYLRYVDIFAVVNEISNILKHKDHHKQPLMNLNLVT